MARYKDSFEELLGFSRSMDRMLSSLLLQDNGQTASMWRPPTDVYETQDAVVILVEIAGMDPDKIQVEFSDKILRVSGKRPDKHRRAAAHCLEVQYGDFSSEVYLPGQYDVTADSAAQCVQLVTAKERPEIRTARVIVIVGDVDRETFDEIKAYCINKVESREASLEKPASLEMKMTPPADVKVLEQFNGLDDAGLQAFMDEMGFAMSFEDLKFCQTYFRDTEHRAPTVTELRVIDTYWSDHCRHTTFTTAVDMVDIEDGYFSPALLGEGTDFNRYLSALASGLIVFDPGSKVMNASTDKATVKARSQFRTSTQHLAALYEKFGPQAF